MTNMAATQRRQVQGGMQRLWPFGHCDFKCTCAQSTFPIWRPGICRPEEKDVADCVDDGFETLTWSSHQMKYERERLKTYTNWPQWSSQRPVILAKAGLYYTGQTDRVQCAFCFGILKNWNNWDSPLSEHRYHFPDCAFIRGEDVGNIPIEYDAKKSPTASVTQYSGIDISDLRKEQNRLATFQKWPANIRQTPESLAKAGFYHIPTDEKPDRVMCAYCLGRLYNWNGNDDPMTEHARCFPKCPYVRLCVGDDVIHRLEPRPTLTPRQETYRWDTQSNTASPIFPSLPTQPPHDTASSEAVQAVLEMGFPKELVFEVVDKFIKEGRDVTAVEVANAVLEMEARETTRYPDTPVPVTTNTSTANGNEGASKVAQRIQKENSNMRDQYLCKICMENHIRVTFLPCGHLACCGPCSMAVDVCPICRSKVTSCVRTYF